MGDVLALATAGIKKTHIMYRGNLSYEQVHAYLAELLSRGMLTQDAGNEGTVYRTTEKGREFLHYYNRINEMLDLTEQARVVQYIRN